MNFIVAAGRPRPRVACINSLQKEAFVIVKELFPTWWQADRFDLLPEKVDYREIDLVIIGPDAKLSSPGTSGARYDEIYRQYTDNAPVISFSNSGLYLPGPLPQTILRSAGISTTEERALPQGAPLAFDHQRAADLAQAGSSRGWCEYSVQPVAPEARIDEARQRLEEGALILNPLVHF